MSAPSSSSTNRKPRRSKCSNADLTSTVLETQLHRLLGLSHGRRVIHPSFSFDPAELLSRQIVVGTKATFCLICNKDKSKLEAHVMQKELKNLISDPSTDLSTVDSSHVEVRGYLHLCLLHSCPSLPIRPVSVDFSFLCTPLIPQEYLAFRTTFAVLEKEGIVLRGIPQAYLNPFVGRAPSPPRLGSPPPLHALPPPPSLPRVATSTTEFAGDVNVSAFLSSLPPPRELPSIFQGPGNLSLLFDVTEDGPNIEFANQGSRRGWSDRARAELGWNRRLILSDHSLLRDYCCYADTEAQEGEMTRKSQQHLQYLLRIMTMVMRSRGRLGDSVTPLDVVCATSALDAILSKMEKIEVRCATILNTVKALISLSKFTSTLVVNHQAVWSSLGLRAFLSDTRLILSERMKRLKIKDMHERVGEKRDMRGADSEDYAVLESVISSSSIFDAVAVFSSNLDHLTKPRFEFVLNCLISYIITYNAARNEVIWKCLNRSFSILDPQTKVRKLFVPFTRFRKLSAGRIDLPKAASMRASDRAKEGWFILDKAGRVLLRAYEAVKAKRMEQLGRTGYDDPHRPFYYNYDGVPIDEKMARTITNRMKKLSQDLSLNIRLNSDVIRHSASQKEYDEWLMTSHAQDQSDSLLALMQHSSYTHTTHYVDSKAALAVVGFIRLRDITKKSIEEDDEISSRVEELRERIVIKPLQHDRFADDEEGEGEDDNEASDEEEMEEEEDEEEYDDEHGDERGEGETIEDSREDGRERREERSEDEDEYRSMGVYGEMGETIDWEEEEEGGDGMDGQEIELSGEESGREECPPPEKKRRSNRLKSHNIEANQSFGMDDSLIGNDSTFRLDESTMEGQEESCRFAGIDGNQAHLCSNGCTCSSSHSAHFIHEHDVKRIAKEIGRNRMTEEERKRLEKGFTLSGLTSDSSRRLFKEIMARRRGPTIERYPWVNVRSTLHCGLGLFSTCSIPAQSIICPYTARIVSEKEFADYRAQVYSERPENADKLFQTVLDYQVEVSLREKRCFLEGFRLTHRGVISLGRYANSSSCSIHVNAKLRKELVSLPGGSAQFLAVLVATRAIAEDEPILWTYDSKVPEQFDCPACVGKDGRVASEPTGGKIRLLPNFGEDRLPERNSHCLDSSLYNPTGPVPYSDTHNRPLTPSDILLAMVNRLEHMGPRLECMGEHPIGSSDANKILRRGRKLLETGESKLKEGETTMAHQTLYGAALIDPSNRHLLLILHKGHLVRALALCPPSSSSFTYGSILVSRVSKKDATSGTISVLGPKASPTDEDRSLISSLLSSPVTVKVVDETSKGQKELFRYD